jgi:hypothetical protein
MKPPRFTIASLMILVAVMAVLFYMTLYAPLWLFFGQLAVLAVVIGGCYRMLKPGAVGLNTWGRFLKYWAVWFLILAIFSLLSGLRMASMPAPGATMVDRLHLFLICLALGSVPLLMSCFYLWASRSKRFSQRQVRSGSDDPNV